MLSEHEILELLEQLKLGALQSVASEVDPVGHWPILIGDGLCLSLQSAAMAEFAMQPEKVTVIGGISESTTLAGICSQYRQVHHASTGLHNRSLLIGYDSDCLNVLPQLHKVASSANSDYFEEPVHSNSSYAYDFSLAIAASLDPAAHLDGEDHPVRFLPLEFEDYTRLAGGWRISIEVGSVTAEFFIGLLNPDVYPPEPVPVAECPKALITVRPQSISRTVYANEVTVKLGAPELVEWHRPVGDGLNPFNPTDTGDQQHHWVISDNRFAEAPSVDLLVQRSLQLSVDDLSLLLGEALGGGVLLNVLVELEADDQMTDGQLTSLFARGVKRRCISINELPVRYADIYFDGVDFILQGYE